MQLFVGLRVQVSIDECAEGWRDLWGADREWELDREVASVRGRRGQHDESGGRVLLVYVVTYVNLLYLLALFVCVYSFLPIAQFRLSNIARCSHSRVVNRSKVGVGSGLCSVSLSRIRAHLLRHYPCLRRMRMRHGFPGGVVFEIIRGMPR